MLLTEFDEKAYIDGVKKQSYADGVAKGEVRGKIEGEARGKIEGEEKTTEKLLNLIAKLKEDGRSEELIKVTDKKELERLYKEYNMQV